MSALFTKDYDIVIVGAGIIGSALALILAKRTSHRIAVVEHAEQSLVNKNPNQRVVALGAVATSVLTEAGVFNDLEAAYRHPYVGMDVWDENSAGRLEFSADEIGREQLGYMVDSVECTLRLQNEIAQHAMIDSYYGCRLQSLTIDQHKAKLTSNDSEFSARLVVGADGGSSWVRRQSKIFANFRRYAQRGIVARVRTAQPHQDTAWQRFLTTGPVAVLPLDDNQSSIVWSADNELADQLLALEKSDFEAALSEALNHRLGEVSLLSSRVPFELLSQRAERYYKRNLVLVGDAAHSIHPLAGQGANLGFKDIEYLASLLRDAAPSEVGSIKLLSRYQRVRKRDNEQTDSLMTALNTAFRVEAPGWLALREVGMNWLSHSNTVKSILAHQAIGL